MGDGQVSGYFIDVIEGVLLDPELDPELDRIRYGDESDVGTLVGIRTIVSVEALLSVKTPQGSGPLQVSVVGFFTMETHSVRCTWSFQRTSWSRQSELSEPPVL